jgi:hypothetical protein
MKKHKHNFMLLKLFFPALLFSFLLFTSCKKDDEKEGTFEIDDPLKSQPEIQTNVNGTVLDEEGLPIQGVRVTVHGKTTTTSNTGSFSFKNITVPGNRCVVICEKDGYFPGVKAETSAKNNMSFTLVMMTDEVTHTIQSSAGGAATLDNGSKVEFPSNGFTTSDGAAYDGLVNLSVKYLDPSLRGFARAVPGGDMMATRTDGNTSILYSYGILRVKLTDPNGDELQLANGKTAKLTIDIPDTMLTTAPETIPLWYFDQEKGAWVEDGSAEKQGDKYIGAVKHFTDWNADDPKERATVIGRAVNCMGNPLRGLKEIFVGQSSSSLDKGAEIDNGDGEGQDTEFKIIVPANTPMFVVVPRPFSSSHDALVMAPVPALKPGQVYDVGDIYPLPCPSGSKGQIITESGDEVESVSIKKISDGSGQRTNDVNTMYFAGPRKTLNFDFLPSDATMSITVRTIKGRELEKIFKTLGPNETVDIGTIDFNVGLGTVSGIAICHNTPVNNASISATWEGGSATASSDKLGVFAFSAAPGKVVTMKVSHSSGNTTKTFTMPSSGSYQAGPIDICLANTMFGENSFVLNDLKRTLITDQTTNNGSYNPEDNTTTILISDVADTLSLGFQFKGMEVGKVPSEEVVSALVARKVNGKWINYIGGSSIGNVTINVIKYEGNVGGKIEASFSGTFVDPKGVDVQISGKFSSVRNL